MVYSVKYKSSALKDLKKFSIDDAGNIFNSIDNTLALNPGMDKELTGKKFKGIYSYRVGDFRVIYTLDQGIQSIYIILIAHRKEVYKILDRRI